MLFGALEAGGTKMVLAIGDENGNIIEQKSIPTKKPENTIPHIVEYFKSKDIKALGIGSFGPVDLDKKSDTYGYITSTPKLEWANFDFVGNMKRELNIPIGFDTDVNASALGEATWGSTKGLESSIYITVGTGVGLGVYLNNSLLHNMLHPEGGHILLTKHPQDDFEGICPYHPNCLEGLASGPAIEKRWKQKAYQIPDTDFAWELEAYYLAQAIINYILTLSPHRIVLGGGVMHQKQLFPLIRKNVTKLLNGYIKSKEIEDMNNYIVPSILKGDQGIMGCIQLAKTEYFEKKL